MALLQPVPGELGTNELLCETNLAAYPGIPKYLTWLMLPFLRVCVLVSLAILGKITQSSLDTQQDVC